ncbi:MAG: APC family permease [Candidatus Limnocylindrales bacterium]
MAEEHRESRNGEGGAGGASGSSSRPKGQLRGRKIGDRRVRVERPQAEYFRYAAKDTLVARPKAHEEKRPLGRGLAAARRVLFGRPLASDEEGGERLPKRKALAIFSSDAISSSAYATEEILRALVVAGATAGVGFGYLSLSLPVSIALAVLLGVVALSYRMIVMAYPTGGGSYSVSKATFGKMPSLVAASALLVGYVLTVAVSVSSASDQIASAVPVLADWKTHIAVGAVLLITLGNLRGLREAGNIFAIPTYLFLGMALLMIGLGAYQIIVEGVDAAYPSLAESTADMSSVALVLLAVRAFSAGSVGLTGTEAIATGVPAFKPPEARNAATTLAVMSLILGTLFIGITFLANGYALIPNDESTIIAQSAEAVFGVGSAGFFLFLTFTTLILILAANTSFAAFPVLASVLANDGFFPRAFAFRGERLAYTLGIVVLGVLAAVLIVAFGGSTTTLIPIYATAIFTDFTISQSGMVRHWLRNRTPGWQLRLGINAVGAVITGIILVSVVISKAPESLLVIAVLPAQVAVMWFIRREYDTVETDLELKREQVFDVPRKRNRVIIPVMSLSRASVQSVQFGRSLSDEVKAVLITPDLEEGEALREAWERTLPGVPLVIVETPFRSLVTPFLHYLDVMAPSDEDTVTIVVLPEYVPRHFWDRILYNQTANQLKSALVGRPDTVVADVPYGSEHRHAGISFRGLWHRRETDDGGEDEPSDHRHARSADAAKDEDAEEASR